ncbi:MAG: flagellin lysine-N-methylase [Spirochaetaceae bacterium]|jgi:lysine-N-methylase|nr:flagellin lysine-N-methylase [Spirochaetaceae bacterium]
MSKSVKILSPSYVKGFKCIGGDCEDSCCIGWDIDIDKLTYRKYFRTKDGQMKKEFVKHVYRNEESGSDEVDYGRVHIKESKWCPFLDENKLCRIYSNLGEDYLSNVCYSYPRVYNVLDDVYELSLFMSCPEVIRKLLASKEPISFIEEEVSLEKHIIHNYLNTKDRKWKKSPLRRLKELRSLSIAMMQDRKLSINGRLLQLGFKLDKMSVSTRDPDFSAIKVQNQFIFQLGFFRDILESLRVFSEIDSPVFVEITKKIISGFKMDEDISLKEKSQFYENAINTIVEPFFDEYGYFFEHYLVNFMFQVNFPFSENQDMFDGYLILVVRYTFMRFYLAGIAAVEGKLTKEDVVLMIQVFTKTIDHHKTFTLDLLQDIKQKEFDNMEFISLFLK